jgi:hypothetical protein
MLKRYIGTLNIKVPEKINNEVQQWQRRPNNNKDNSVMNMNFQFSRKF